MKAGEGEVAGECARVNAASDKSPGEAEGHDSGISGKEVQPCFAVPEGVRMGGACDQEEIPVKGAAGNDLVNGEGTGPGNYNPINMGKAVVLQNLPAESGTGISPAEGEGILHEEAAADNQGEPAGENRCLSRQLSHPEGVAPRREAGTAEYRADTGMASGPERRDWPEGGSRISGAHNPETAHASGDEKAAPPVVRAAVQAGTVDDGGNRAERAAGYETGSAPAAGGTADGDEGLFGEDHHEKQPPTEQTTGDRAAGHGRSAEAGRHQADQVSHTEEQVQETAAGGPEKRAAAGTSGPELHDTLPRHSAVGPEKTVRPEGLRVEIHGSAPLQSPDPKTGDVRIAEHAFTSQSMKMEGVRDVTDSIVYMVRGSNRLGVTVDHRNFGRIDISLSQDKGMISVQVNTSDRVLREFMESNIQSILDTLQEEGISVGEFTVALREQGRQGKDQPLYRGGTAADPATRTEQEYGRTGLVNIFA